MSLLENIPAGAADLVVELLSAAFKLVRAADNEEAQEEAAMEAAEATKKFLDRKKFGGES